jgi:hypothetical protein
MNKQIEDYKLLCDFCGSKKPLKKLEQVPLRIDKHAKHQMLFGFMCAACGQEGKKVTMTNQQIRTFTGRSRHTDEKTLFDEDANG